MHFVCVRPRVDHPVDRPELYGPRGLEVTGTNGRLFGPFYRSPSREAQNRVLGGRSGGAGRSP